MLLRNPTFACYEKISVESRFSKSCTYEMLLFQRTALKALKQPEDSTVLFNLYA